MPLEFPTERIEEKTYRCASHHEDMDITEMNHERDCQDYEALYQPNKNQ